MVSYAKARADFEYLESVAELDEQVDLDARRLELMENPTKETAADMYCAGITLWFDQHCDNHDGDRKVAAIRKYYEDKGYSL